MRPLQYPNSGDTVRMRVPKIYQRDLMELIAVLDTLGEDATDVLTSITDNIKERNG